MLDNNSLVMLRGDEHVGSLVRWSCTCTDTRTGGESHTFLCSQFQHCAYIATEMQLFVIQTTENCRLIIVLKDQYQYDNI